MGIALAFWGLTLLVALAIGTVLCSLIERSGMRRWGACGRLFGTGEKKGADR